MGHGFSIRYYPPGRFGGHHRGWGGHRHYGANSYLSQAGFGTGFGVGLSIGNSIVNGVKGLFSDSATDSPQPNQQRVDTVPSPNATLQGHTSSNHTVKAGWENIEERYASFSQSIEEGNVSSSNPFSGSGISDFFENVLDEAMSFFSNIFSGKMNLFGGKSLKDMFSASTENSEIETNVAQAPVVDNGVIQTFAYEP